MKDIINILDLSVEEIDRLIATAERIMEHPEIYANSCRGKTLATLFYEPSTRTRLSFEAAMYGLGGNVLGFSDAGSSSVSKGETVSDTAKIVSIYSDIMVMRHYSEGAPCAAGLAADVPVINAGDGGHFHPTQTLADLLTIKRECGRFDNLTIGLCGDLKYGRTVHSLISAMTRYNNVRFVLISPKSLALPEYVKSEWLDKKGIEYIETDSLDEYMSELDILYMTRIQKERFDPEELARTNEASYVLALEKLAAAKESMRVLHPLPRVDEIAVEVDSDPRAKYFMQAKCGMYMRMALILTLLADKEGKSAPNCMVDDAHACENPRCIAFAEKTLEHRFYIGEDGTRRCFYCDAEVQ